MVPLCCRYAPPDNTGSVAAAGTTPHTMYHNGECPYVAKRFHRDDDGQPVLYTLVYIYKEHYEHQMYTICTAYNTVRVTCKIATPPRTIFHADFLDNGDGVNAERCVYGNISRRYTITIDSAPNFRHVLPPSTTVVVVPKNLESEVRFNGVRY